MNILIINQPGFNRGDESAHKALIRSLINRIPNIKIKVLYTQSDIESIRQFSVSDSRVTYIQEPYGIIKYAFFQRIGMQKGYKFFWRFHPTFIHFRKIYKWSDHVICAPGGICMGGFQNWQHLFYLELARFYNKSIVYYGRSFGPFPTKTKSNRVFKKISLNLLHYFSFLSIRDSKTELLAKKLNIPYISTVDTAFLDSPSVKIPYELSMLIGNKPYMVFVPNYLLWHYAYKGRIKHETIIKFYSRVIDEIFKATPDLNIVMLPQLFCGTEYIYSDVEFFRDIAETKNDQRIIVIPDCYSSDIQQTIVNKAKYVIGGRYHSIVFAINQCVPCIALSYEHKISGLLETLGKTEWCVDFSKALDTKENQIKCLEQIRLLIPKLKQDNIVTLNAKDIANTCMNKLLEFLKNGNE